jgi:hypothetical protein
MSGAPAVSQSKYIRINPVITEADIINAATLVDPLAEKIKDIAPTTFSLHIINVAGGNKEIKASMKFTAYLTLEEDRVRKKIASAETKEPFRIPVTGRLFTSKDADDPKSDINLRNTVDEPLKKKLKEKIVDPASGGRVPSGLYEIHIEIWADSVGGEKVTDSPEIVDRSVTVTNPSVTILDLPFENGYLYPTPFPQFQWTYDTRSVEISVYELKPENESLEDAISSSVPFLQVEINRKESGNLTTFTYPQSQIPRPGIKYKAGPRQLERGKMYVVVLDGIRTAFGFDIEPLRTIRSFAITDPQGQVILNTLQTIFSGTAYENIVNTIRDQKLLLNPNGIRLNNIQISTQDLQLLLNQSKSRITSVRIEE